MSTTTAVATLRFSPEPFGFGSERWWTSTCDTSQPDDVIVVSTIDGGWPVLRACAVLPPILLERRAWPADKAVAATRARQQAGSELRHQPARWDARFSSSPEGANS